ncbi:hypothetical protein [Microbacterium sp. Marseille-Q6965]|uniref:DUF7882 family protein n=1 Tax=Microbacterium sp. Marseille-Q6965 TaxID=2965072 RepID=UPI0021B75303|nr:hypothetical protein [Microbacterium sp. Marseille-Q6965]
MGQLFYGSTDQPIEVDDELLMHVQLVAFTKLRRGESFVISWKRPSGAGRETIWVHSSIPLRFVCEAEPVSLDGALLEELAHAATSSRGMDLSAEKKPAPGAAKKAPLSPVPRRVPQAA